MSEEWFYAADGEQVGPVSWGELRRLAGDGKLAAADLVWNETMAEWAEAGTVEGLVPQMPIARKPPPLPRKAAPPAPPDTAQANRVTLEVKVGAAGGTTAFGMTHGFDLLLDGKKVAEGSLVEGLHATLETTVGQHSFTLADKSMEQMASKGGIAGLFAGVAKGLQTSQSFPVGFTAPGHYEVTFPVKSGQRGLPGKIEVTKK